MTTAERFEIWAPSGAAWSDWAKPVLFAHMPDTGEAMPLAPDHVVAALRSRADGLHWLPQADGRTAIVLDLPAQHGVDLGLLLACRGFRPVPLYNAVPWPGGGTGRRAGASVCDMLPQISALMESSAALAALRLPPGAPPAFLLDSARRTGDGVLQPGRFDNRSVSLPTDFPSANLLRSRGVDRALLVQSGSLVPQPDLSHTLLRWQQAGIAMEAVALDRPAPPSLIHVSPPSLFRVFFQRLVATMGLRPNPLGGFGGVLPEPSSGSAG